MRLTRVYAAAPLGLGARVALHDPAAAHVRRVLRLDVGDPVTLFNGDGRDYPSRITACGRDMVEIEVEGTVAARPESPLRVTLVQGIARAERMDLVVQKATELGVAAIVPVATARSVVRLDGDGRERKTSHWRGIVVAACEQSGRATVPDLADPITLAEWLAMSPAGPRRLLLSPDANDSLAAAARGAGEIELLVGPEGGLEEEERRAALDAGYCACRLGPRVLRSETAAMAALAVLQSIGGDL